MPPLHSLLRRQVKKYFGQTTVDQRMEKFIAAVDETYNNFDSDRKLIERSVDISSQELMQNVSLLRATLNATEDGILVVDLNDKIVSYNANFLKIWDIPESVIACRQNDKLLDYVSDKVVNCQKFLARVKHLYANPEKQAFDTLEFVDGRIFEDFSSPQKIGDKIVGRVWSFRDVTIRKHAENALRQSKKMLQSVIDNVPQSVFWKDENFVYLGCNLVYARMLGLEHPRQVVGKTDYDLGWQTNLSDSFRAVDLWVMKKKSRYQKTRRLKMPNGNKFWVDVNKVPLYNRTGQIMGVLGTYDDVSERILAEVNLKNLNSQLEKTVDNLENTNQQLSSFVSIASHDLREPLRKICSFGILLSDSLEGQITEDQAENLGFMIEGSQRMTKMVEGLLVYSGINDAKGPLERRDLNRVVEDVKGGILADKIARHNVCIELPQSLPEVWVNSEQVKLLLFHIIDNAIKFCSDKHRPHIVITAKPAPGDMVKIEIADNGIGLSAEYHQTVFTMFKRLHDRELYTGDGIGLALCKRIIEKHNGKIGMESQPGHGSVFWFTLPAVAAESAVGIQSKIAV